ncbi:MraY family glycosyltransferase [Draconibacterium halophilum]|uniref:Undecaprenyl/decaprenyl-phosphate alpha-N-acetylglucosaminyl 1-phosphate transferase n=1 Tax=Draconibacterium halophilum TaxID=2706887 RepID=A0A6C0RDF7_9BACT|nr:MraY family glycosyltransferase [Draconibacterium halophilum]QIA08554.1 undecaprenyl/decaprenyl-phosphate alpha-N-acetylglucosaminyl 1-phosphate transferase [Draconibacterium halophilum]
MEIILILSALILGFLIVLVAVPPIIRTAKAKHLFEPFEERKVHTKVVPPLGGVAIFIGFTISAIFATDGLEFDALKYIIAGIIFMFFIGLKDDLMIISARKKLIVQIIAAILFISFANIHFTNLHGVFGQHKIGHLPGISLSLFAMIVIINAFNLIDGVDGLASGLGMLVSFVFGTWFYLSENYPLAILAFALVGSLAAFFLFNVFGNRNKLFMGDTGSLIIGFIISVMVVYFNEMNLTAPEPYRIGGAPAVSFAIIIVPLIDTLRVMTIRIGQRRSPFSPDKNHVHHRLLELLDSHLKVTLTIISANILIIATAIGLNHWGVNVNIQFILIFFIGLFGSFLPSFALRFKKVKKARKVYSS